jgi:HupE / UreJ protein
MDPGFGRVDCPRVPFVRAAARAAALTAAVLFSLASARSARAHDETVSSSTVEIAGRQVRWKVDVGVAALAKVVALPAAEGQLQAAQLASVRPAIAAALVRGLAVKVNGQAVPPVAGALEPQFEPPPAGGAPVLARVIQTFVFHAPTAIESLSLRVAFFSDLTVNHRALVRVIWGQHFRQFVRLGPSTIDVAFGDMAPSRTAIAREFVPWGIEHIFLGYDHVAFLLALLLAITSLRELAIVVTSFTAAHSLTLMLSALELVRIPSRVSETLIAASIVYVAVENLGWVSFTSRHRWLVTFAFGLVHGLGFATELRARLAELGGAVVVPVISFNLGVELGQLAIVLLVFPLLVRLRRGATAAEQGRRQRRLMRMGSVPIVLLGLYWFVDRLFG